jgi:hypothetical protein
VREDEPVHADHDGQRDLLGELERLDVQVERLLVGLGVELDPARVALRHRVAVVVPDVDRRADRAVGDGHDDRQPEAGGVVQRLDHVEQALARGRRVGARAVADAPMATDMAANSDSTLTNSHGASLPPSTIADRRSTMCVCGEMG